LRYPSAHKTSVKINTVLALFVFYLAAFLPIGMLCYARAYLAFAHHRHSTILFEVMASFEHPANWPVQTHLSWYWPAWHFHAGTLSSHKREVVEVNEKSEQAVGWSAVWGETAEAKLDHYQYKASAESIVWNRGRPVSGLPELELVGTVSYEGFHSIEERWDPAKQKTVEAYVRLTSTLRQVYNQGPIWYVFSAHTSHQADLRTDTELARLLSPEARSGRGHDTRPRGTFQGLTAPEDSPVLRAALDALFARAQNLQPGAQPLSLLLQWVSNINFRYAGTLFLSDNALLHLIWATVLYVPTLPIRYLLFGPLILAPHWLVMPLALVYPFVLLLLAWLLSKRYFTPRLWRAWKWLFWTSFLVWFACITN